MAKFEFSQGIRLSVEAQNEVEAKQKFDEYFKSHEAKSFIREI